MRANSGVLEFWWEMGEAAMSLVRRVAVPAPVAEDWASALGSLVWRPTLYRRGDVSWISTRAWRSDAKRADLVRLKAAKAAVDPAIVAAAADDIVAVLTRVFGTAEARTVVNVPCGHSRRPDCFGRRLAEAVAARLGWRFLAAWCDRFITGVSHPKEFDRLPPLQWQAEPDGACLVVDDVATSGWHMHEALTALRSLGLPAVGAVWIGGEVS